MISAVRKIASTLALRSIRNQPRTPMTTIAMKIQVYQAKSMPVLSSMKPLKTAPNRPVMPICIEL